MEIRNYIEDLLCIVASECNVKQIIGTVGGIETVFNFDTLHNKKIGIDEQYNLFSLIFSGNVIEDMKTVEELCSSGLKQRNRAKIKVRQPLQSITVCLIREDELERKIYENNQS